VSVGRFGALRCLLPWILAASGCRATAPAAPPVTPAPVALAPSPVPPLPELGFRAGEPPWRALGISAVVRAPAATEAALDALSRTLALPTPLGRALIDVLTGPNRALRGVPLRRALFDSLDPAASLVLVTLAPGIGVTGGTAWGLAFRDAAAARRVLAQVGLETARAGGASTRRLTDGSVVHAGVHGRTLFFSTTPRLISVAGPLIEALAARPPEHLATVSVFPQALPVGAAVLGGGLEAIVTKALRDERAKPAARPGNGASRPFAITDGLVVTAGLASRLVGNVVADTRAVRLELDLDEHVGLALRLAVEPIAGSKLESGLRPPTPAKIDPRLLGPSSGLLLGWGMKSGGPTWFEDVFDASGPAGRALHADWSAWRRLLAGPGSCKAGLPLATLPTSLCAQPLARGVKSAEILRRNLSLARDTSAWLREIGMVGLSAPEVRLAGDAVEIDQDTDIQGEPAAVRARRHTQLGGAIRHTVLMAHAADGLYAWAPDRQTAAAALAHPAPGAPPSPAEAAVLAHAEGADVVVMLDAASMTKDFLGTLTDPRIRQGFVMLGGIRGVTELHLPLGLTLRTGDRAAFELQVPVESLRNVADVVRPYMGVMGASAKP
jgi:hypothetical protein